MKKSTCFHHRGIGARGSTLSVAFTNPYMVSNRHHEVGFISFHLPYRILVSFQSKNDYFMFTQTSDQSFIVILLHVDDTRNDVAATRDLEHFLSTRFRIKDLGPLKYFFEVEITWSKFDISFCQWKYTLDILEDAGLLGTKPKKIHMEANIALMPIGGDPHKDHTRNRRLVG